MLDLNKQSYISISSLSKNYCLFCGKIYFLFFVDLGISNLIDGR